MLLSPTFGILLVCLFMAAAVGLDIWRDTTKGAPLAPEWPDPEPLKAAESDIVPVSWWWRLFYAAVLVLTPTFLFYLTWNDLTGEAEWQSGELWLEYSRIALGGGVHPLFMPLVAYAMLALCVLLVRPATAEWLVVRLGIYTGLVLALQYTVLISLAGYGGIFLVEWSILGVTYLIGWLLASLRSQPFDPWRLRVWMVLIPVIIALNYALFVVSVVAAVALVLPLAAMLAWPLFSAHDQKHLADWRVGLLWGGWLGTFGVVWWQAYLRTLELYASLPIELRVEDCYIATAAAHGHPALVQTTPIVLANGRILHLNPQLQTLKAAELALWHAAPRLHRLLRKVYDVLGRAMAQHITHPLTADAAYLLLKPAEWFARWLLAPAKPAIDRLYGKGGA